MMNSANDIARRLVPRWRSLSATIKFGELAHSGGPPKPNNPEVDEQLAVKVAVWSEDPSIQSAGEVVEASIVAGQDEIGFEAAKFVMSDEHAATLLKDNARQLIARTAGDQTPRTQTRGDAKRQWRDLARECPNNALAWVELSLMDVLDGRRDSASRSMQVALGLAPNNRHVLRAAARLFLHLGDPERSHAVLLKSEATPHDPWLSAAEIAVANVAGKRSATLRQSQRLLDGGNHSDWDLGELAGAVGTEEMLSGRRKKARDLFRRSVLKPTGNALAQAEWASPSFPGDFLETMSTGRAPEADEAVAIHAYRHDKLSEVMSACDGWARSEPYSIRPYEMASGAAAESELYEKTIEYAKKGLVLRPDAPWLLNNIAFASIYLGLYDEALPILAKLSQDGEKISLVAKANYALLSMKLGNYEQGASWYQEVIDAFRRKGEVRLSALAGAYFAKAAAESASPEAGQLLGAAEEAADKLGMHSIARLLGNVRGRFELGERARNMQPLVGIN